MILPQLAVIAALALAWDRPWHALAVAVLVVVQLAAMARLLTDPRRFAPWFNGTGVALYVSGMMVAAFAVSGLGAGS
jgi:chlorophyll synthase